MTRRSVWLSVVAGGLTLALFLGALLVNGGSSDVAASTRCAFAGPRDLSRSYMIGTDSFTYDVRCPSPATGWKANSQIQRRTAAGWRTVSTIAVDGRGSTADRIAQILVECRHNVRYRGRLQDAGTGGAGTTPRNGLLLC
jgi:hypothetical protein